MLDWLRDNLPERYADAILWVLLALLLFFILLVVIRTLRSFRSGTFVLGGRNRRTRLAVMDATPVDSRRRLVLVRRDDVEHLILIGGPTDVVVEQDIRMFPRVARSPDAQAHEAEPHREQSRQPALQPTAPRKVEPPRPVVAARPAAPVSPQSHARLPPATIPMSPPPAPPPARPAAAQSSAPIKPAAAAPARPAAASHDDLLHEDLEITLDEPLAPKAQKPSADEEMTRLLGELSQRK